MRYCPQCRLLFDGEPVECGACGDVTVPDPRDAEIADRERVRAALAKAGDVIAHAYANRLDECAPLDVLLSAIESYAAALRETTRLAQTAIERNGVPAMITITPDRRDAEIAELRAALRLCNDTAAVHTEVELSYSEEIADLRARIAAVGAVLSANGCECDCGHDDEGHDAECERCWACRVEAALTGGNDER